eukprot:CAMPEP_0201504920 /NCGR_PEP_ID=MMETSP0151_2-20130828/85479_1 /ASSEMBLY_ACC=CAM_ASM_000257 /TAXON_ID=200890 /ORGANISM="Paramoeba atlantica, Strain 621/1 / CCAP 1560/9" /LENGTH=194 /DNA_ID=CAMNT_0047898725 /DNA_START=637 /DNA_END=1221 /DNA_ORIENTATION=-
MNFESVCIGSGKEFMECAALSQSECPFAPLDICFFGNWKVCSQEECQEGADEDEEMGICGNPENTGYCVAPFVSAETDRLICYALTTVSQLGCVDPRIEKSTCEENKWFPFRTPTTKSECDEIGFGCKIQTTASSGLLESSYSNPGIVNNSFEAVAARCEEENIEPLMSWEKREWTVGKEVDAVWFQKKDGACQ